MDLNLSDFLDEVDEILERVYQNLNNIENNFSESIANELYREVHTLKGSTALFGFERIAEISHIMESILEPVRTGDFQANESLLDILIPGIDAIRDISVELRSSPKETSEHGEVAKSVILKMVGSISEFVNAEAEIESDGLDADFMESDEDLKKYSDSMSGIAQQSSSKSESAAPEKRSGSTMVLEEATPEKEQVNIQKTPEKQPELVEKKSVPDLTQNIVNESSQPTKTKASTETPLTKNESLLMAHKDKKMDDNKNTNQPSTDVEATEATPKGSGEGQMINETLRVPVQILENLMNLVGELVLVRNQHMQYGTHSNDSELVNLNQRLNYVTGELQEEVMKTRMQRIGSILTKFNRVVRDLSKSLDKSCRLILEGTETELDKTLLEAVKDPLMHIVRNSVDHGMELPDERVAAGKPAEGKVVIKAYHEGGQVIVEISDDGRGLDPEKIVKKAIEKGVIKAADADRMSDRDIFMLIFAPGFSTAEKISSVSGRGVGMDVVKTNIERIGGNIDLSSVKGHGATVKLRIPLTLAIIPALIVRSGAERFSIPQVKLVELVRLEKDENGVCKGIEELQGTQVYRLRGQLLPLVNLNSILNIKNNQSSSESENIVVLNADSGIFGLIVEDIEDSNDIVIKPLMQFLKDLSVYSGATILGDGNIALTLDVTGLAGKAGIFSENESTETSSETMTEISGYKTDIAEYLLVDIGMSEKYAIPLCMVHRLEDFNVSEVKKTGNQDVVRYRNSLLPIISVKKHLQIESAVETTSETSESKSVVVINKSGKSYGLEVDRIEDVVAVDSDINSDVRDRQGILGNAIIDDNLVVVLDTMKIIDDMTGHFDKSEKSSDKGKGRSQHNILLAEDNNFYRKYIMESLTQAGYQVYAACDGKEAFEMLQKNPEKYSILVSDIEMPEMDGCELVESIIKEENIPDFPMIAVSSKFNDEAVAKGIHSGFEKYLEKLKMDELLETIDSCLKLSA